MKNFASIRQGLIVLFSLIVLSGCQKEGTFKVSPTTLTDFTYQAATKALIVESSSSWTAHLIGMTGDWCQITINTSGSKGTISIAAEENTTVSDRSCSLMVSASGFPPVTISIKQVSGLSQLALSKTSISEGSDGGVHVVDLTSNTRWELAFESDIPGWVSFLPASGQGNGSFSVEVSPNLSGFVRQGKIIATAADTVVRILSVSQATAIAYEMNAPDFSGSFVYDLKDANDQIIAKICHEYLAATESQQTVIYKVNAFGALIDRGYILENGGSVNPDGSGYAAGSSSPVSKVYLINNEFTSSFAGVAEPVSSSPGLLEDIEGTSYKMIKAGSLYWMAENLRVRKLKDGTALTDGQSNWPAASEGIAAYSYYDPASPSRDLFGLLYNWFAVNTGKLAPEGWHVPSDGEWSALEDLLGGPSIAGGNLKQSGTLYWQSPNAALNIAHFNALPGGYRASGGAMQNFGYTGNWWTTTEGPQSTVIDGVSISTTAYYRSMLHSSQAVFRTYSKRESGYSVRCVKEVF